MVDLAAAVIGCVVGGDYVDMENACADVLCTLATETSRS